MSRKELKKLHRREADNVFSDGVQNELANITGSITSGLTATLTIGVAIS